MDSIEYVSFVFKYTSHVRRIYDMEYREDITLECYVTDIERSVDISGNKCYLDSKDYKFVKFSKPELIYKWAKVILTKEYYSNIAIVIKYKTDVNHYIYKFSKTILNEKITNDFVLHLLERVIRRGYLRLLPTDVWNIIIRYI